MNSKDSHPDLSAVAENIQLLLSDVPELVHSWRFLAGVVYALDQYYQLADCSPRPELAEEVYVEETREVLSFIKKGQIPAENWLRAFFYNAAAMRLNAAYERFFKACLPGDLSDKKGPELYREIRRRFPSSFQCERYEDSLFGQIRREVNSLKHYPGGADPSQREQPDILHRALTELVAFLDRQEVANELKNTFSGREAIAGRTRNPK